MRLHRKSAGEDRYNRRYDEYNAQDDHYNDPRESRTTAFDSDRRAYDSPSAVKSEIYDRFHHVHDELFRLEKIIKAQIGRCACAASPAHPRFEAETGGRPPLRCPPVQMRDMANFMLSREGDHFLNLIRQIIREEVDAGLAEHYGVPAPEADQEYPHDDADDLESLRDLIRQSLSQRDRRRRA